MKVVALKMGFFNGVRRREGDGFEVPEGTKSKWFVPMESAPAPKAKAGRTPPTTLKELGEEKAYPPVSVSDQKVF